MERLTEFTAVALGEPLHHRDVSGVGGGVWRRVLPAEAVPVRRRAGVRVLSGLCGVRQPYLKEGEATKFIC